MTQPLITHPSPRGDASCPKPEPWRWPLPRIGTHEPRVVGAYASETRRGVDIGYATALADQPLVPVYATQGGELAGAGETDFGYAIALDHCNRSWSTVYTHLAQMNVPACGPRLQPRETISAGTIIGFASRSPHHVRFELWQWTHARGFAAVDPIPYLTHWTITATQPRPIGFAPRKETH
jgi:murein DD-endopeptidase MepM/ murein hydrolase activator NlpD